MRIPHRSWNGCAVASAPSRLNDLGQHVRQGLNKGEAIINNRVSPPLYQGAGAKRTPHMKSNGREPIKADGIGTPVGL